MENTPALSIEPGQNPVTGMGVHCTKHQATTWDKSLSPHLLYVLPNYSLILSSSSLMEMCIQFKGVLTAQD